jgi:hypothetical protein
MTKHRMMAFVENCFTVTIFPKTCIRYLSCLLNVFLLCIQVVGKDWL